MNKHLFKISLFCLLSSLYSLSLVSLQSETISLPDIDKQYNVRTRSIHITGDNPALLNLAKVAFGVHGAFKLSKESASSYILDYTLSGANTITLKIIKAAKKKVVFEEQFQGKSNENAVLLASDAAVQKLTDTPGFFSGNLAFVSDRSGHKEVYRSDMFFYKVGQLTSHKSDSITPHWSPDGSKVVYVSYYKTGYPDLFVADINSRKIRTFASYRGTNQGGVFSPFGRYNAMILSNSGNAELYIGDAAGRNPKRITRNKYIESSPTWSLDARRIILTSDQRGSPQLYQVNIAGGSMKYIPTNISRYCAEPDWNQYYTNLVLFTAAVRNGFQLALYDLDSGVSRWLTAGAGDSIEGKWLHDGRHIVFTKRIGKRQSLHILDSESGKVSPLHDQKFGNTSQASFVYLR